MEYAGRKPQSALKPSLNEIVFTNGTGVRQSVGCSPFEVNSGCTPNSVWHTIAKCALSSKLSWRNVLYSLDRNKHMFPHELYRKTQAPDDDTTLGMYNRVVHTLAESTPFSCGELSITDQQKGCHMFRKNQERLKLQPNLNI